MGKQKSLNHAAVTCKQSKWGYLRLTLDFISCWWHYRQTLKCSTALSPCCCQMFFLFLSVFIWHSAVLVERWFSRGNESSLCYDHTSWKAHDEPYVILTFKLCFTYFKRSLVWFLSLKDLSLYAFWLSLCVCTCVCMFVHVKPRSHFPKSH